MELRAKDFDHRRTRPVGCCVDVRNNQPPEADNAANFFAPRSGGRRG